MPKANERRDVNRVLELLQTAQALEESDAGERQYVIDGDAYEKAVGILASMDARTGRRDPSVRAQPAKRSR
jgi:hypothetical protein